MEDSEDDYADFGAEEIQEEDEDEMEDDEVGTFLGFTAHGLGFRVHGLGFFRLQGLGLGRFYG